MRLYPNFGIYWSLEPTGARAEPRRARLGTPDHSARVNTEVRKADVSANGQFRNHSHLR
jgi:hypothetical protein